MYIIYIYRMYHGTATSAEFASSIRVSRLFLQNFTDKIFFFFHFRLSQGPAVIDPFFRLLRQFIVELGSSLEKDP